jgi:SnoaL-like domain
MPFTGPVEDRIAIRELMDTHAHGVMTRDAQLWGSIWAEDASWSLSDYPDLGDFEGRAAIVAAWSESMTSYGLDNCTKPMVYFMQPGSIAVDGNSAKAPANASTAPAAMTTRSKSAMANGCSPGANMRSCWRSEREVPTGFSAIQAPIAAIDSEHSNSSSPRLPAGR